MGRSHLEGIPCAPTPSSSLRHGRTYPLLLLHYSTWHSRFARKERYRITVGSGKSTSMMNILEWDSRVQGIVSTGTVATEARASMLVPTEGEEVDLWTGMRETRGSRAENGEPINESTGPVLNGTEGGEEEDGTETSTVDGGNNRSIGIRYEATKLCNTGAAC